jgi:hypothetical protein
MIVEKEAHLFAINTSMFECSVIIFSCDGSHYFNTFHTADSSGYNRMHGCIPVLVTRPIQGPPITDTDTDQLRLDYTEFDIERLKRRWKSYFSIKQYL